MDEFNWQLVATGLCVMWAIVVLGRKLIDFVRGQGAAGCGSGGCGSCPASTQPPTPSGLPLVSLDE